MAINKFANDTQKELDLIMKKMRKLNVNIVLSNHWAKGGKGALDLAKEVVNLSKTKNKKMKFLYNDNDSLWDKINIIAKKIYHAKDVIADKQILDQISNLQKSGFGHFPICIAKTQSSFSNDPKVRGAPINHSISIREIRLAAGAEFIVVICGNIMTLPGLPKIPSAEKIDFIDDKVVGLF